MTDTAPDLEASVFANFQLEIYARGLADEAQSFPWRRQSLRSALGSY